MHFTTDFFPLRGLFSLRKPGVNNSKTPKNNRKINREITGGITEDNREITERITGLIVINTAWI
jgi:hypothetical protein